MHSFDASSLISLKENEYVVWIDVMGTQSIMSLSMSRAANFIFKLHAEAIASQRQADGIKIYPVMDGFYASCKDLQGIRKFIGSTLQAAIKLFNGKSDNIHKFIIRGALACGPVVHGNSLDNQNTQVANTIKDRPEYMGSLLIGMPIVQAYKYEKYAPPFGVFVHESARAFDANGSLSFTWFTPSLVAEEKAALVSNMTDYFDWCKRNSLRILYDDKRIDAHREMFKQAWHN